MTVAQQLWTVGKSQPDACDPVFKWLREQGGITAGLAWERIRLAMEARQPRLALYLASFLPAGERVWVDRWYQQNRAAYRRLDRAQKWPDLEKSRQITSYGLRRLARSDPDRAWKFFAALDSHFSWSPDVQGSILREIALWSAVGIEVGTAQRMRAVPATYQDGNLLEWWVRYGLATENWAEVILVIARMPSDLKDDERWRYWDARARLAMGDPEYANKLLGELAQEANYYGFWLPTTWISLIGSVPRNRMLTRPLFRPCANSRVSGVLSSCAWPVSATGPGVNGRWPPGNLIMPV